MHPVKPDFKSEWLIWLLIIVSIGLAFYFQGHLPETVPSHWNFTGEVDGYASRGFGAWFGPVLLMAMYLLFFILPYIDPKRERYAEFRKQYHGIKNVLISFIFLLYVLIGLAGLGYNIAIDQLVPLLVGLLLVLIGYYLRFVKRNWMIGVRTPWTIESETVWNKTNSLMAKLMMLGGVLIALDSFLATVWLKLLLFAIAIAGLVFVPIVYSYVIYRQEQKKK